MRSVQSPAKALKGLSFEIADLIGIRERSEANGLRMVVRLDYGSDVEEYEEVLAFHAGTSPQVPLADVAQHKYRFCQVDRRPSPAL